MGFANPRELRYPKIKKLVACRESRWVHTNEFYLALDTGVTAAKSGPLVDHFAHIMCNSPLCGQTAK